MVVYAYNPSTYQPGLQSEFLASHGYIVRPCLKLKRNKRVDNGIYMT